MGSTHPEFVQTMMNVVREFDPTLTDNQLETRASSGGRYTGLTVTVLATDREQLDNIYRALSSHPMVKMVL
jgi:uncharacterized protein